MILMPMIWIWRCRSTTLENY